MHWTSVLQRLLRGCNSVPTNGWNCTKLPSSGLEMGDAGPQANRVLHLAFKDRELVGCASSTFSPGWTPDGCGHWGLLAVHPDHQKSGVATALVIAAERRLATICGGVQIEYQYTEGDDFSRRLRTAQCSCCHSHELCVSGYIMIHTVSSISVKILSVWPLRFLCSFETASQACQRADTRAHIRTHTHKQTNKQTNTDNTPFYF